jgi:hypothetical protein
LALWKRFGIGTLDNGIWRRENDFPSERVRMIDIATTYFEESERKKPTILYAYMGRKMQFCGDQTLNEEPPKKSTSQNQQKTNNKPTNQRRKQTAKQYICIQKTNKAAVSMMI